MSLNNILDTVHQNQFAREKLNKMNIFLNKHQFKISYSEIKWTWTRRNASLLDLCRNRSGILWIFLREFFFLIIGKWILGFIFRGLNIMEEKKLVGKLDRWRALVKDFVLKERQRFNSVTANVVLFSFFFFFLIFEFQVPTLLKGWNSMGLFLLFELNHNLALDLSEAWTV